MLFTKKKILTAVMTVILWVIAIIFIFFRSWLTTTYFGIINGDKVYLDGSYYKLSPSAFILDVKNERRTFIVINGKERLPIIIEKMDEKYINVLLEYFPDSFNYIQTNDCKILEKRVKNDKLPNISWYNKKQDLYFNAHEGSLKMLEGIDYCHILTPLMVE
ncbi:MAG: hypothetical protein ACI8WB_001632 [Phenylobacterium sp.]|jgi:hypothetical protein